MYQELVDEETGGMIISYTDPEGIQWSFPPNESNRMYQDYLLWKQENN